VSAKVQQAVAAGKIELAGQHEVQRFRAEIDELLDAIGHPEALVTDLSALGDFADLWENDLDIERLSEHFQVQVHEADLLVDLAARIRAARREGNDA
jgi:hypothetical protein